jgi:hypothetical protein
VYSLNLSMKKPKASLEAGEPVVSGGYEEEGKHW